MEFLKLFMLLICVALMMHVTESRRGRKGSRHEGSKKSKESKKIKGSKKSSKGVGSDVLHASTAPGTLVSHDSYGSSNYTDNTDSLWVIEAEEGYTIDFSIKKIEIENGLLDFFGFHCNDFVEVFDGRYNETNTRLGKYCGSIIPGAISSTGQYMLVQFHSDYSYTYPGFSAEYKEGGPITN